MTLAVILASVALAGWQGLAPVHSVALVPVSVPIYGTDYYPTIAAVSGPMPPIGTDLKTGAATDWHRLAPMPKLSATGAIAAYFDAMMPYVAASDFLWRDVLQNYRKLQAEHGWPDVSAIALSRALLQLGCKRSVRDLRSTGRGRLTVITFPPDGVAP